MARCARSYEVWVPVPHSAQIITIIIIINDFQSKLEVNWTCRYTICWLKSYMNLVRASQAWARADYTVVAFDLVQCSIFISPLTYTASAHTTLQQLTLVHDDQIFRQPIRTDHEIHKLTWFHHGERVAPEKFTIRIDFLVERTREIAP